MSNIFWDRYCKFFGEWLKRGSVFAGFVYCRLVFGRGAGEDVGAVAFGDKEEVVVPGRKKHRPERKPARVADWTGRKPGVKIGVVG